MEFVHEPEVGLAHRASIDSRCECDASDDEIIWEADHGE